MELTLRLCKDQFIEIVDSQDFKYTEDDVLVYYVDKSRRLLICEDSFHSYVFPALYNCVKKAVLLSDSIKAKKNYGKYYYKYCEELSLSKNKDLTFNDDLHLFSSPSDIDMNTWLYMHGKSIYIEIDSGSPFVGTKFKHVVKIKVGLRIIKSWFAQLELIKEQYNLDGIQGSGI